MLKKRMGDPSLIILTMNILIKDNLSYKEIMVYIQDRQVRNLLKKIFGKLKITWRRDIHISLDLENVQNKVLFYA